MIAVIAFGQWLLSQVLAIAGKVLSDVLKDWISRPDAVVVDTAVSPLRREDLGGLPSADRLLADWERVPRH